MNGGLETTVAVLAATKNESAVGVLIQALDTGQRAIQEGALRALLKRRSHAAQEELVRRWHTLSDRWKSIIAERPGRIVAAVRDALASPDSQLCANGCEAVLCLHEYDLMPALLNAAEEKQNPHAGRIAQTLITLAELLYDELASPRDYRNRRDPQIVRQHVLASLERSVQRFNQHHRSEILEAFLLLTNCDNLSLKHALQNPYDSSFLAIVDMLTNSPRPGVMRLLLNYLDDPLPPLSALNVVSHRRDVPFLRRLLRKVGGDLSAHAKENVRRMESVPWLQDGAAALSALNDAEQRTAVRFLLRSGVNRQEVFETLRQILQHGRPGGRREAALALHEFRGADADQLVLEALDDSDPEVQAYLLAQLRDRGVPEALDILLTAVDSPHDVICEAVQKSLADFTFSRYLLVFDKLEEKVRRGTGLLVKKIDAAALAGLTHELESESRSHRLRGLEMAIAMEVVRFVEPLVLWLLHDDDHIVRTLAADALVVCDSAAAREALQAALSDPHVAVRDAAENTLQQLTTFDEAAFTAPHEAPLVTMNAPQGNSSDAEFALPTAGSEWEIPR